MASDLSLQRYHLTAAEKVTSALRNAITAGEFLPGAPIRQNEIAEQHQVSRMPVREALRQLETEGLIVVYPGQGAFITRLSAEEIQEIYDIRVLLESDALKRAIPLFSAATIAQAEGVMSQLETAPNNLAFGELDQAFHTTIYQPAQRPRLLNLIATYRNLVTRFYYVVSHLESFRAEVLTEHRQILDAYQAGDANAAVAALEHHLQQSAQSIIEANQSQNKSGESRVESVN